MLRKHLIPLAWLHWTLINGHHRDLFGATLHEIRLGTQLNGTRNEVWEGQHTLPSPNPARSPMSTLHKHSARTWWITTDILLNFINWETSYIIWPRRSQWGVWPVRIEIISAGLIGSQLPGLELLSSVPWPRSGSRDWCSLTHCLPFSIILHRQSDPRRCIDAQPSKDQKSNLAIANRSRLSDKLNYNVCVILYLHDVIEVYKRYIC